MYEKCITTIFDVNWSSGPVFQTLKINTYNHVDCVYSQRTKLSIKIIMTMAFYIDFPCSYTTNFLLNKVEYTMISKELLSNAKYSKL